MMMMMITKMKGATTITEAMSLSLFVFLSLTTALTGGAWPPTPFITASVASSTGRHPTDGNRLRHHQQHQKAFTTITTTTTTSGVPAPPPPPAPAEAASAYYVQHPGPPTLAAEVQLDPPLSKRAAESPRSTKDTPASGAAPVHENPAPLRAPSALVLPPSSLSAAAGDLGEPVPQTLTICALLPFDPRWLFSVQRVHEAVQVALTKVTSGPDALLPAHINLTAVYRDSNCSISVGIKEAIEAFVADQVTVFFGPCCDFSAAPVGRQAKYWNIPMITSGALSSEFARQKDMYSHLTRIGPNFNSLSTFVLTMLAEFHWHRVLLVYDSEAQGNIIERFCHVAINGIYKGLDSRNQKVVPDMHQDHFKVSQSDSQADLRQKLVSKVGTKFASEYF